MGKRTVSSVTLTIFIWVFAKRTVSGTVSGSVPEEGTSLSDGEFFTKGNEGNDGGGWGPQSRDLGRWVTH